MRFQPLIASLLIVLPSLTARVRGDVPVPQRILNPTTAEEAWNVMRLATANVERLIKDGRASEVVDQISICGPALRIIARTPVSGQDQTKRDELVSTASQAINLIARDSLAGNAQGVSAVFANLSRALQELTQGVDQQTLKADLYHCPDHPDFVTADASSTCEKCQRKFQPRRIPYSFIFVEPGTPTVNLTATPSGPISAGNPVNVTLHLNTLDGKPVAPGDLVISHVHRVHVIIVDSSLTDYHFTHAEPLPTPGEYQLSFTPAKEGRYRLWAAIVPCATGLEEHTTADLNAEKAPNATTATIPGTPDTYSSTADGYHFQLAFPSSGRSATLLQARRLQAMRLLITDSSGQPVKTLEPFIQSFSQVTGIYTDQSAMFKLHPAGGDVLLEDQRGGPTLLFKLYPPQPGPLKLFCNVQIGGKMVTATFHVTVAAAQ